METADEPPDTCSICFEDVGKEDPKLLCKHAFHMACLMEWAASETSRAHETISCPNCRGPTFTKDPRGIVGEQVGPWWTAPLISDCLQLQPFPTHFGLPATSVSPPLISVCLQLQSFPHSFRCRNPDIRPGALPPSSPRAPTAKLASSSPFSHLAVTSCRASRHRGRQFRPLIL
jgi:hypothetical protein